MKRFRSAMADELDDYLRRQRGDVERELRNLLRLIADAPTRLQNAVEYSLLAPGKRLRPILVIMACEACGGKDGQAMPAACSVEMVHAYSLIHDDLPAMDDDDLRRGQPTCHKQFGEALAILAGDALLTLAFEVLSSAYPPRTAHSCCRELARAAGAAGMVGGQVADLGWESRIPTESRTAATLSDLIEVHARKTGALFQACLKLGMYAAYTDQTNEPAPETLRCLDGYGRSIGQMFQITDDLLDAEGNAERTGKRVRKDATRGKLTYPAMLGLDESRRRADNVYEEARRQLAPLGSRGDHLIALAEHVLYRDR
jgi:geranylgeranyl diphosphate synthase type II